MPEEQEYFCSICGKKLDVVSEGRWMCDHDWYSMRLMPRQWLREMKDKGIEVERTEYPIHLEPNGWICGDPYKRKET